MVQEIGETRQEMRKNLLSKQLYEIASDARKDKGLDEFWILLTHREDAFLWNVIRQGVTVFDKKPPMFLNSMCFHVIWTKGVLEPEWILPRDIGIAVEGDQASRLVYNSCAQLGGGLLT